MKLFATSAFAAALLTLQFASAAPLLLEDDQQQLLAQQDASLWLGADSGLSQIADENANDEIELSETSAADIPDAYEEMSMALDAYMAWMDVTLPRAPAPGVNDPLEWQKRERAKAF